MSDCPLGCGWRYDGSAEPVCAWPVGYRGAPIVWDGALRLASPHAATDPRKAATGAHVCFAHPGSPEAEAVAPYEPWNPIGEFNRALTELTARPWWRRLLPA